MDPGERSADAKQHPTLEHLRRVSHQLDDSIRLPFGVRVGWDAVLGLIPGFGDGAGALLSTYVVLQAARLGAPAPVLLRMVGNVGIEAVFGAVPLLGDVFDAAWKANLRNVALLQRHLDSPESTTRASKFWIAMVLILLVAVLGAGIALAAFLLIVTVRWLFGSR